MTGLLVLTTGSNRPIAVGSCSRAAARFQQHNGQPEYAIEAEHRKIQRSASRGSQIMDDLQGHPHRFTVGAEHLKTTTKNGCSSHIKMNRKSKPQADTSWVLEEPAATSHTPVGWPIRTIEIKPRGKAPAHHGPHTYSFGAAQTLSVILPRRGWTLVKKTKNYAYLIPPPEQLSPPFHISIAVPPDEECLAIACRCYLRGESWYYQLGEWPAAYLHERNTDMVLWSPDPATSQRKSELLKGQPKSCLFIGEMGVWETVVTGEAGLFAIGHLPPSRAPVSPLLPPTRLLHPVPPLTGNEKPTGLLRPLPLSEGTPQTLELTVYERNASARNLCIAHYGTTCQACGLNYEDKYGPIAAGLIHVHHVKPLSDIGQSYQVDPIHDLVPLCATCHHVAHRREQPYTVAEIRAFIAEQLARSIDLKHSD